VKRILSVHASSLHFSRLSKMSNLVNEWMKVLNIEPSYSCDDPLNISGFQDNSIQSVFDQDQSLREALKEPQALSPVPYRFEFALACFSVWVYWWYHKLDLGRDVFGYKGDNIWYRFRKDLNIYCWWFQGPLVWYSMTYPNQWIDYLTLFAVIIFGGGWYDPVQRYRKWLGLHHELWGYILCFLLNASHHNGATLCILFESDANKRLYRIIFVWGWLAHTLSQITRVFDKYLPGDLVWTMYWKLGPLLYGFWYITRFMESDEQYLSPSVIVFWFGRWMWSWNFDFKQWQSESYNTILFLLFVHIFVRDSA